MKRRIPRKLLILLLALSLAGAAFFTVRSVARFVYWTNPAHREQVPEGWMTLGYVERSHRLPPRSLGPLLGIEVNPKAHRSLAEIAAERGQSLDAFLAELKAALEHAQ